MTFKRFAATALICSVLWLAATPTPASAVPDVFRPFTHNVQYTQLGAVRYLTAPERSSVPLTIALQELCKEQFDDIHAELNDRGYISNTWHPNHDTSQCRNCWYCDQEKGFYVSAFSVGARAPGLNSLVGQFSDQAGRGSSRRGFACFSGTYGRTWWSCSTHLESSNGAITAKQSENMAAIGRVLSSNGHAAIVGGDFNREPWQQGMATWYSSYAEADSTYDVYTYPNNSSRNRKYDYIFSTGLITDSAFGVATVRARAEIM